MPATATKRKLSDAEKRKATLANLISDNAKQGFREFGSGVNDVLGRGTIAGLLGAPGDIANLGENALRALLNKPSVTAWGGSEHIGQKMQDYGLVSDVRRPKTEMLASLISPAQLATATLRAPKYAKTMLGLLDNLDAPNSMRNWAQRGAVDVNPLANLVAPQDEALRIAQRNASLPVEQGGLGLHPNNTPEERALAMGFDTDAYHGGSSDITAVNPEMFGSSTGANSAKEAFWGVSDPTTASGYADYSAMDAKVKQALDKSDYYERLAQKTGQEKYWDKQSEYAEIAENLENSFYHNREQGQNILPLLLNTKNAKKMNAKGSEFVDVENGINNFLKRAKKDGKSSAVINELADDVGRNARPATHYAMFSPSNIRSRFAAFDPLRRDSSDLLAGLAPLGIGGYLYGQDK